MKLSEDFGANGQNVSDNLTNAGYDAQAVQNRVITVIFKGDEWMELQNKLKTESLH